MHRLHQPKLTGSDAKQADNWRPPLVVSLRARLRLTRLSYAAHDSLLHAIRSLSCRGAAEILERERHFRAALAIFRLYDFHRQLAASIALDERHLVCRSLLDTQ